MKKVLIFFSVILIITILACSKNSDSVTTNCGGIVKSYSSDINPIIQNSCAINAGCHGAGSTNGPGPLTNYSQVFSARVAIRTAVASGTMPQNSSLSTADKNSIICWIDSGAPNN